MEDFSIETKLVSGRCILVANRPPDAVVLPERWDDLSGKPKTGACGKGHICA